MRKGLMIALGVVILAVLNYGIYEKEQILHHGDIIYLELAPVDPRSLMQGDYMVLHYAIASEATKHTDHRKNLQGQLVIHPDENQVATFRRIYDGGDLKDGERLIAFHQRDWWARIPPASFFFQEGHAASYENARYGMFKFDAAGRYLLTGLADENRELIQVPVNKGNAGL